MAAARTLNEANNPFVLPGSREDERDRRLPDAAGRPGALVGRPLEHLHRAADDRQLNRASGLDYALFVPICQACGQENPEGFRFCGACAAELAPPTARREVRKTVTVVFCDVTGSTALGERLDPEAMRRTMGRYFEEIRADRSSATAGRWRSSSATR